MGTVHHPFSISQGLPVTDLPLTASHDLTFSKVTCREYSHLKLLHPLPLSLVFSLNSMGPIFSNQFSQLLSHV